MDRKLIESTYEFELTDKEMGKLRKMNRTVQVMNKINGISGVRGIAFAENTIRMKVEPRPTSVADKIVDKAETIIKDQLL